MVMTQEEIYQINEPFDYDVKKCNMETEESVCDM